MAGPHQVLHTGAESTAGGQFVGVAAAVGARLIGAPDHPHDLGTRDLLAQLAEVQQCRRRGVTRTDDRTTTPGEPVTVATLHVGQRARDRVGDVEFTAGGDAGAAEHVRAAPGTGRVDHRRCQDLRVVGLADQEGCVLAAGGADPVEPDAGHRDHLRVVPDPVTQLRGLGQRREVAVDQVAAGRERVGVGSGPAAGLFQQAAGCGVDVVAPRAEQHDVAPFVDRCRNARPVLPARRSRGRVRPGGLPRPGRWGPLR